MPPMIITLTTDFGEADPYVPAMKGVLLALAPEVRILDLSHQIQPQDVLHAAFFLSGCIPYFPPDCLHLVVVDPGVGTARRLLYAELGIHRFLAPDNGVLALLAESLGVRRLIELTERRYWRSEVSATFHGRDVLAPVAAHLARGLDPSLLGPQISELVPLQLPICREIEGRWVGEILHIDRFGNLLTNLPGRLWTAAGVVEVGGHPAGFVTTYGEAHPGELVALVSSQGLLEVAVVNGSAARSLGISRGAPVELHP